MRISASILEFYFGAKKDRLSEDEMIERINSALESKKSRFQLLQFDIMDGLFVPSRSFTPKMLSKIKYHGKREAHLMVVHYKKYLEEYLSLADMFIFHHEVLKHDFPEMIGELHRKHKFVGIALNPETHISDLEYLDKVDMVLVMSVHPGLPGQKFLESSLIKVRRLKELRREKNLRFTIEMDGGIKKDNIRNCEEAGADIVVMGTGLFDERD